MQMPGTVEWLYSTNCAILPFRWTNVTCCPRCIPTADRGDLSSNIGFGRDLKIDGRSISLPSLKYRSSDGDDDATSASLREVSKDEHANFASEQGKPDSNRGECPQDQIRCVTKQVSAPLESAAVTSDRDESMDWQEEKKQWISAAGVTTPSELERKIENMRRAAAQNEADLKKLTCHVAEVKTFLLQLHEMDKYVAKRKGRCERSSRRRKRPRRRFAAVECLGAMSDNQESSTERATTQKGGPLLDPQIMRSFGNLIKSSS